MAWQLRDPTFQNAIRSVIEHVGTSNCALAGTAGIQAHIATAIGLDKRGPPARRIELVVFSKAPIPDRVAGVPVARVDTMGFEASVEADCRLLEVNHSRFPVASPEHILGMCLGGSELPPDTKWACFLLMRTLRDRIDLEQARGFLKRCPSIEHQALLAELAYLAA